VIHVALDVVGLFERFREVVIHSVLPQDLERVIALLDGSQRGADLAFELRLGIGKRDEVEEFLVARVGPDSHFERHGVAGDGQRLVLQADPKRHSGDDEFPVGREPDLNAGSPLQPLDLQVDSALEDTRVSVGRIKSKDLLHFLQRLDVLLLIEQDTGEVVVTFTQAEAVFSLQQFFKPIDGFAVVLRHAVDFGNLQFGLDLGACAGEFLRGGDPPVKGSRPRIFRPFERDIGIRQKQPRTGLRREVVRLRFHPLQRRLGQLVGRIELTQLGIPFDQPDAERRLELLDRLQGEFLLLEIVLPRPLEVAGEEVGLCGEDRVVRVTAIDGRQPADLHDRLAPRQPKSVAVRLLQLRLEQVEPGPAVDGFQVEHVLVLEIGDLLDQHSLHVGIDRPNFPEVRCDGEEIVLPFLGDQGRHQPKRQDVGCALRPVVRATGR